MGVISLTRWYNLNYFPMGFETICKVWLSITCFIWTISLWDLKPVGSKQYNPALIFELFPYGIWNRFTRVQTLSTSKIWTISLWDLKQVVLSNNMLIRAYIWTISLWDLKLVIDDFNRMMDFIWTISLWDLKHIAITPATPRARPFELFPYGIWNLLFVLGVIKKLLKFELFPYGIWNK